MSAPVTTTKPASYKVYAALLTQTGTSAPIATVLQNTLGGTVVWSRVAVGTYLATLTGAFPMGKVPTTFSILSSTTADDLVLEVKGDSANGNDVRIVTFYTASSSDDILSNHFVEIRVYP